MKRYIKAIIIKQLKENRIEPTQCIALMEYIDIKTDDEIRTILGEGFKDQAYKVLQSLTKQRGPSFKRYETLRKRITDLEHAKRKYLMKFGERAKKYKTAGIDAKLIELRDKLNRAKLLHQPI